MNRLPSNRHSPLAARGLALLAVANLLAPITVRAEEPAARSFLAGAFQVAGELAHHSAGPWVRQRLLRDEDATRYGLQLDEGWEQAAAAAPRAPVVIFIHGFNSTPLRNAALMVPVRRAGFPAGAFAYPNDWAIEDSAKLLSTQLKEFAAAHPTVKISLVTHSMGGLVARACVEDPKLDPGNVARLVMIAPPTHGTLVAKLAFGADLWEHWIHRSEGDFTERWRDSIVDGLGEADDDLLPGSAFLTQLNARERNPRIRYAIFLGTHAAVTGSELKSIRWALRKTLSSVESLNKHAESLDGMLASMDELVEGKGDGVVSLASGRLAGVDDVVVLPFNHLTCTGESQDENDAAGKVQSELLARLR
jgi:pimeloyl-ACP methyl ester carboxylesterase